MTGHRYLLLTIHTLAVWFHDIINIWTDNKTINLFLHIHACISVLFFKLIMHEFYILPGDAYIDLHQKCLSSFLFWGTGRVSYSNFFFTTQGSLLFQSIHRENVFTWIEVILPAFNFTWIHVKNFRWILHDLQRWKSDFVQTKIIWIQVNIKVKFSFRWNSFDDILLVSEFGLVIEKVNVTDWCMDLKWPMAILTVLPYDIPVSWC